MSLDFQITWQFAYLDERERCREKDVDAMLSANERLALNLLHAPSRRRNWLAGRILAKQLILEHAEVPCRDARAIDIMSCDAFGRGHRPQIRVRGRVKPWCLSISHTSEAVLVALCTTPGVSIGVDLVKDEPLGPGFPKVWFDPSEQWAAASDATEVCCLWAAKEAFYKAINRDDSFTPRAIHVRQLPDGDYTCVFRGVDMAGCCRVETWSCGNHLAALATFNHTVIPRESALLPEIQTSTSRR